MATNFREVTERLFHQLTGDDLDAWVAQHRDPAVGDGKRSWRRIASELRDEHNIDITDVTLISWYGTSDREPAA